MNKKTLFVFILIFFIFFQFGNSKADIKEIISNEVNEQLSEIDFTDLENYIENIDTNLNIRDKIKEIISGNYDTDYSSVFTYIFNLLLGKIREILPIFLGVISVSVLLSVFNGIKSSFLGEDITEIIFLISFLSVSVILITQIFSICINVKNDIENLSVLCQIMSPILVSLMIVSGGNISASIFKPSVAFLTGGIFTVFIEVLIPILNLAFVFDFLSNCSREFKLKKLSDFLYSLIKWIIGILISVFGILMTVQGISGGISDGLSIRATKYLLSNSVPIVGGLLNSGFDFIVYGSVLIKNAVGFTAVFLILFTVIPQIVLIISFSILLRFSAGISEAITNSKISEICISFTKYFNYLLSFLIISALTFFITVLLMIFSFNGAIL